MSEFSIGTGITIGTGIAITSDGTVTDPYFANVSLLLTGQGTVNSRVIVDSSINSWNITNGTNSISYSANNPKVGTTSIAFPGIGSYLRIPQAGVANFGSGNWTIEGWMKFSSAATYQTILWLNGVPGANAYGGVRLDISNGAGNANKLRILIGYTGVGWATTNLYSTTLLSNNIWYYFTLVRNGATVTLYVNGVAEGTYNIGANSIYSAAENWIGAKNTGSAGTPLVNTPMTGNIEQLRITTGVARYTANFTPPNTLMPTS